MRTHVLKLPDLGEGVVESEVVAWYVAPGDRVTEDQHIADVMTDKAMVEIGSPVDGQVVALGCKAGDILAVGGELIRFEIDGAGNTAYPGNTKGDAPSPATPSVVSGARHSHLSPDAVDKDFPKVAPPLQHPWRERNPAPLYPHRTVLASPSIRHRARESGVDLSRVPGSGRDGRIQQKDLDIFLANERRQPVAAQTSQATHNDGTTIVPLSGLRRVIARKMAAAKREIPHYTYVEEVDVTELEKLRQHLNDTRDSRQPKLTLLPFFLRALVKILPRFPHCNATYDAQAGQLTQYRAIHPGIATMTTSGLMVPVIRHCEQLDLWQCATEIARLSDAARNQSIRQEELKHSTITITSLGAIGGLATTPIINPPETAIIGINRMQKRPVVTGDDRVAVRAMMNISASFDHRIIDGQDGALLIQALKEALETPAALFL